MPARRADRWSTHQYDLYFAENVFYRPFENGAVAPRSFPRKLRSLVLSPNDPMPFGPFFLCQDIMGHKREM